YHVSRAWVDALKQRRRETGAFAPLRPIKFRGRALATTDLDRLAALVAARPDATLAEIREALRTAAGLTTIWRALNQLDFTLKKNGTRRRTTATRRRRDRKSTRLNSSHVEISYAVFCLKKKSDSSQTAVLRLARSIPMSISINRHRSFSLVYRFSMVHP